MLAVRESSTPSYVIPVQDETKRLHAVESLSLLDTPPEADFDEAVRLAASICNTPISLMTIVDRHRQWFKSKIGLDIDETPRDQAFCAHAIGRTTPLIIRDAHEDERFVENPLVTGNPNIRFYAGMPLHTSDGYSIGTLCVIDTVPRELTPQQESALTVLGRQISTQIELRTRNKLMRELLEENQRIRAELETANQRLLELSLTDTLTRLRNRRAFEDRLAQEITNANLGTSTFSLLLIDIDSFKGFNDEFGHPMGDEILCTVARILVKTCRTVDLVARHGGEEFAILLPNTAGESAMIAAERLRSAVETHPWAHRQVTISAGVATSLLAANRSADIFLAADRALYTAKAAGRNRVVRRESAPNPLLPIQ
jgi:diguanylate cyclase (GGDEF)-like protein